MSGYNDDNGSDFNIPGIYSIWDVFLATALQIVQLGSQTEDNTSCRIQ